MKTKTNEETPEEILVAGLADFEKLRKERADWQRRMKFFALEDRIQKWIEEDAEMRSVEFLSGEHTRWAVRLHQTLFEEPGEKTWTGEGASYAEAFEVAFQKWEVDRGHV